MSAPVTAIVTAYRRREATLRTLDTIAGCMPPPAELIVHVDGGGDELAALVHAHVPSAKVIVSAGHVGPGGARNLMVKAATQPLIASFDDDSYPMDPDFFQRVTALFEKFPDAWVLAGRVFHVHQAIAPALAEGEWAADFSGGGCAYRRERYLEVGGYVPLPDAYNMEEVDFAIRLHARGGKILGTPWLRVFHDTDLARHSDPEVTSASIANLALLAFLRYPVHLWSIGAGQCANRIQWLLRHGRRRGILAGLAAIPSRLWRHRHERQPVPSAVVRSYLALRRRPVPAPPMDPAIARAHG
ncbi:MAG TPA: glycosyltransferase [Vicinamibacterales bacterium]|nr:glycosyltransferase [Vicinamibacterales bacterium]